ncbi:DUF742 domain-containing protein [Actinocatenispora comari]|jgi:hypothetical protein|uniref:DUF742 domain-containing protein n=1 Tax=Actinocatenispora comari TaxID=2807577 RepID=A0A8J4EN75_9ACTN|nr:DUF742 domain-containing protein [Actinocatenispora comari]GIL27399.1 hypothetical protein NUM_26530 [Actinocatenispora comari]
MAGNDDEWLDDDAGGLVPLYAVAGRRATAEISSDLNLGSMVRATTADLDPTYFEPHQVQILRLCQRWLTVAEISAMNKVPLTITKRQLADLIDRGVLAVSSGTTSYAGPTRDRLVQVLDGLRAM